jgi:acyl carrier protein
MENQFLIELDELLELPIGTLKLDTILKTIQSWDSMAKLSLIVMLSDNYNVKTTNDDLKKFKTVEDIFNFIRK